MQVKQAWKTWRRQGEDDGDFLRPGGNCWRRTRYSHASVLVDCADYYRALYSSIVKAQHSIFIIGWDIDSRIRLLRGDDVRDARAPVTIGALLGWKAAQRPDMKIHLLRWDSSFMFLTERELLSEWAWSSRTPENVHVLLDSTIPAGGSHHQKIVVVDDEVAFTGGMDVARKRWDNRDHDISNPDRVDTEGLPYDPYHDVQAVVAGSAARDLAELARRRWRGAAGYEPLPMREVRVAANAPPPSWPDGVTPCLRDGLAGISRTVPPMEGEPAVHEVWRKYLDAIMRAQDFIYAENQFFTHPGFAAAINRRLKQNKKLRVLLVSSFSPQGYVESAAFWTGRVAFMARASRGIESGRIGFYCPAFREETTGEMHYKRIHAKVLAIDDEILVVASSNINTRSMQLDTECDLTILAENDGHRAAIARVRNGLIAEHSGKDEETVARMLREKAKPGDFLGAADCTGWHLCEREDERFADKKMVDVITPLVDPSAPLATALMPFSGAGEMPDVRNPTRKVIIPLFAILGLLMAGAAFLLYQADFFIDPDTTLRAFLEDYRHNALALPAVCLVYVLGGLVLFPMTILSLITAAVFGAVLGPVYAMCGALLSGAVSFGLGHAAGFSFLRCYAGERIRSIGNRIREGGVFGVAALRLLPIAPFTLVNLALGISPVSFGAFMAGTFLGLLPGMLAKGLVGDSLMQVFLDPSPRTVAYLVAGVVCWFGLAYAVHRFAKKRMNA